MITVRIESSCGKTLPARLTKLQSDYKRMIEQNPGAAEMLCESMRRAMENIVSHSVVCVKTDHRLILK